MTRHRLAVLPILLTILVAVASAQDPLPSWHHGPAKQAILNFVKVTTEPNSPKFVPPEERIAKSATTQDRV